jgi:hemolysin activation/secretion protein
MKTLLGMAYYVFVLVFASAVVCFANGGEHPSALSATRTDEQAELEKQAADSAKVKAKQEALRNAKAALEEQIEKIALPDDTTPRFTVKEIRIEGNILITTDELLAKMPLLYNTSEQPLNVAESKYLYDFRPLHDIIVTPGQPQQVSARTIQGFTQYLLSVYNRKNYAGIYVYVPAGAVVEDKFKDEILPVEVLEAPVTDIWITFYDPNQSKVDKGHLRSSLIREWSPAKVGQVANQKKLDEFVNLLNLNPDRYVSAMVTKGTEPKSLAVKYDVYEANPWHWFVQADNAGTRDRQWSPRVGVVNTNLSGRDDTFSVVYQAPWEKGIEDEYSVYGSYDMPLLTPKLRVNFYAGYSQFDITPATGGFDFIGNGFFYGTGLRYNVLQQSGWLFDITGSLSHEKSKITPSLFPEFLQSEVAMDLIGWGLDLHRSSSIYKSNVTLTYIYNIGGSSSSDFTLARQDTERDFSICTLSAGHSQYLDTSKVHRLSGTFRWIMPSDRLVPAKMTTFGGLYSVRGYDEDEIVADGGILFSAQYEFDLAKYGESKEVSEANSPQAKKPFVRKLAPLAFFDCGRAENRHPLTTEKGQETLSSVGLGLVAELGDHFSGAVYAGYPLTATDNTDKGECRMNATLLWRW